MIQAAFIITAEFDDEEREHLETIVALSSQRPSEVGLAWEVSDLFQGLASVQVHELAFDHDQVPAVLLHQIGAIS